MRNQLHVRTQSVMPSILAASWFARRLIVCVTLSWLAVAATIAAAQDAEKVPDKQSVIVVVGAEGTPEFGERFRVWAERWKESADRAGAEVTMIGLDSLAAETSATDRDQLQAAISQYGSAANAEPLWLILMGHGTWDNKTASFSLRGPDISAAALAELCATVQRPMNIINCSSCSSPFLNALSGDNRVIVTATKDGNQVQYSRFGDYMSQAVAGLDADIDRDGQTSLLEAWLFAARRTAEFYAGEGRLATEHSLLDDTGDQRGTRSEIFDGFRVKEGVTSSAPLDGQLAARRHLIRSADERLLTPEQRQVRDDLETRLEELRLRRNELPEAEYLNQLEEILLPLAKLYESLAPATKSTPEPEPKAEPSAAGNQ